VFGFFWSEEELLFFVVFGARMGERSSRGIRNDNTWEKGMKTKHWWGESKQKQKQHAHNPSPRRVGPTLTRTQIRQFNATSFGLTWKIGQ